MPDLVTTLALLAITSGTRVEWILTDLAIDGTTQHDITFLNASRFAEREAVV